MVVSFKIFVFIFLRSSCEIITEHDVADTVTDILLLPPPPPSAPPLPSTGTCSSSANYQPSLNGRSRSDSNPV